MTLVANSAGALAGWNSHPLENPHLFRSRNIKPYYRAMYSVDAALGAPSLVGRDGQSRLITPAVFRPLAGQHPPGVRPGLLDEGEQNLGRQRHARLVVVPGPH